MDKSRIVVVRSSNPFQLFMMLACVLSGVSGLFIPKQSSAAVESILPRSIQVIWYIGLVIGGILALYGMIRNIYAERLAVTILAGISIGYQIVFISQSTRPFALASIMTLSFSVACILRVFQINRILKRGSP